MASLEQAVSAPMCTRVLADSGARVIKIGNPNGGDFVRYDDAVNGLAAHLCIARAELSQRRPRVIGLEIGGYGPGGPLSHQRAYDALAQAESGAQNTADAAGIDNARYNRPSEVLTPSQLAARNRWRQIDIPAGPIPSLLPPSVISGYQPPMGAVPGLRQHTDSVLAELGMTSADIAALHVQGVAGPVCR
ncbi:CoA transferase [Mycobacterium botniense]|uniref:CoA transferase n=1 Tax=Mycobacterium botniense TaxID=84962 RepID=A0A7I9XXQ5_9MYCO|nr:CoA transferase [Mycobacterium botniense]GFG74558.1 hypothetical protein MBOT_19230 [Mycobacterium botniense]